MNDFGKIVGPVKCLTTIYIFITQLYEAENESMSSQSKKKKETIERTKRTLCVIQYLWWKYENDNVKVNNAPGRHGLQPPADDLQGNVVRFIRSEPLL